MQDRKGLIIGIIIGSLLIVCLCCFAVFGGSALLLKNWVEDYDGIEYYEEGSIYEPTPTAHLLEEWEIDEGFGDLAMQTLNTLEDTIVPENDPADLAVRLGGVERVPELLIDENAPYEVGDRMSFWVLNTDTNNTTQVPAILRYETPHAYFWIGETVNYQEDDLEALAESFENDIYPTTREFFGSEWTPGIDGDPHIYILYMPGIGFTTAGYFVSSDSVHPLAHEYSNAHEVFVFNSDNSPLRDEYTYGVLAHEFQHMIHWYRDRNETSWLNEGFSEVSTLINGFDPGGFDYYYTTDPDVQLNDWPNDSSATTAHYGASFLFMTYFLDRMGKEASQMLVEHPENGLKSIDLVLEEIGAQDPLTGKPLVAEDLVLDWALTNYIMDENVLDGRFHYGIYPDAPQTYETENFYECDPAAEPRTVHQFGVDYIRITCPGETNLHFEGARNISLLPVSAHSGDFSFWTNKGDESDMTLTRQFDFTGVEGEDLTFSYWTWYDIEADYDYVYLLASTDGETWDFLDTPSGTDEDPSGNSYGWGYNGISGGDYSWIQEEVDLSAYAGQKVWLRFEYVTDAAVNGEGMLLDDMAIPAIEYKTDFEDDDGGWEAEGFVRVPNLLPQSFRLALVREGDETTVEYLDLPASNQLDIPIEIAGDVDAVTLVVVGTARFTRQVASYELDFLP